MNLDIVALLPTALVSLLWYLFKQKDDRTAESIKLLWQRHDEDALALQELRLNIVEEHYKKAELDHKFNKVEAAILLSADRAEVASNKLAEKFDRLADALSNHLLSTTQDRR